MKPIAILFFILFTKTALPAISSYNEIQNFITNNPRSSADDLLASLDNKLTKTFTLTYHGEGLLGATPENPTIILMSDSYGSEAPLEEKEHLWLAFRASSTGENAHLIDLLRWNPLVKRTELKQIVYLNGSVKIVNEPISCQGCHRGQDDSNNARVLWGNYPFWPGSIGSYDRDANFVTWSGNPSFSQPKKEQELLNNYVENFSAKNLRFKYLPNFKKLSSYTGVYTGIEGYGTTNTKVSINAGNFNFIGAQKKLLLQFEKNCEEGKFDKKEILDFINLSLATAGTKLETVEVTEANRTHYTLNESHFMGENYVVALDYTKNHLYDLLIESYESLDPSGKTTQDFVSSFDQRDSVKQLAFVRQAAWNFSYIRMRNSRMFLYFLEMSKLPIDLIETTMIPSRSFAAMTNKIEFFLKNSKCLRNKL